MKNAQAVRVERHLTTRNIKSWN